MVTVVATDADDPTYGNSARVTYSLLQGQPYFSVEPKTGKVTWTKLDVTPEHTTAAASFKKTYITPKTPSYTGVLKLDRTSLMSAKAMQLVHEWAFFVFKIILLQEENTGRI